FQRADVTRSDRQGHAPRKDPSDLFAGDVAGLRSSLDREAVEDVVVLVAFDLRDPSNVDPIGSDDTPPRLDLKPRDGIVSARRAASRRRRERSAHGGHPTSARDTADA